MNIQEWRIDAINTLQNLNNKNYNNKIEKLIKDISNKNNPDHEQITIWQSQIAKILFINNDIRTKPVIEKVNPALKL